MTSQDQEQPLVSHLIELRTRLLRMIAGIFVVFAVIVPFANPLYTFMAGPLLAHLPENSQMIAIEVVSPFLAPIKLTLILAFFIAIPWVLYQLWGFVAPGLYSHEKQLIMPLIVSSTVLFYCGMAFAYFIIMPIVFAFLTATAPQGVAMMTDINKYLDFVLLMFFAFGIAFEVPVATVILVLMGIVTPQTLAEQRSYIILGAFIVGMLLTPPDVVSQILLSVPMWLLFEVGLIVSRILLHRRQQSQAHDP